jgi:hypothetical protein
MIEDGHTINNGLQKANKQDKLSSLTVWHCEREARESHESREEVWATGPNEEIDHERSPTLPFTRKR